MLPIRFVVGTARRGRPFLRRCLLQRPNMSTGPVQEPSFSAFASGASYARSVIQAAGARLLRQRHAFSIIDARATRRLFLRAQGRLERGSCTPAYVSTPAAAVKRRKMVPDTSLVAMLLMLIMTAALLLYVRQTGRPGVVYR